MNMLYIIVDAMMSGSGIRDAINGGYIPASSLALSEPLKDKLNVWLKEYEDMHFSYFSDSTRVADLDEQGICLAQQMKAELKNCKVGYYSAALNQSRII